MLLYSCTHMPTVGVKGLNDIALLSYTKYTISSIFGYTGRHLPYGITQCYLTADTGERTLPNPSQKG